MTYSQVNMACPSSGTSGPYMDKESQKCIGEYIMPFWPRAVWQTVCRSKIHGGLDLLTKLPHYDQTQHRQQHG